MSDDNKFNDEESIDPEQLLALNREAARKEQEAQKKQMNTTIEEDDDDGIEFEATTTIKNVADLISPESPAADTSREDAEQLEKKVRELLKPFEKSKNPQVLQRLKRVYQLLGIHSGRLPKK